MSYRLFLLLIVGSCLVAACNDDARYSRAKIDDNIDNDDETDEGQPAIDEEEPEIDEEEPEIEPTPIRIVLENQRETPVYVQSGDYSGLPVWFTLYDQRAQLAALPACDPCPCDSDVCAGCGLSFGTVAEVAPLGGTVSWFWDGYVYRSRSEPDGTMCRERVPAPADELEVGICWSSSFIAADDGDWVDEVECDNARFTLGEDDEVVVVATPVVGPGDGTPVEGLGWYTAGFEHSGLTTDPNSLSFDSCFSLLPNSTDSWWVGLGTPTERRRSWDQPGLEIALIEYEGLLSEEGQWGHLGSYPHQIDLTRAETQLCEMARLGGRCIRPELGDVCVRSQDIWPNNPANNPDYISVHGTMDAFDPDGSIWVSVSVYFDNPDLDDEEFSIDSGFRIRPFTDTAFILGDVDDMQVSLTQYGAAQVEYPWAALDMRGFLDNGVLHYYLRAEDPTADGLYIELWLGAEMVTEP